MGYGPSWLDSSTWCVALGMHKLQEQDARVGISCVGVSINLGFGIYMTDFIMMDP